MKIDPAARYTRDHEWIRAEGSEALIGISDYAQDQLSDIVYVQLPEVGDTFQAHTVFATVESVKAASDIYMPAGGEIVAVNEALEDSPEMVNKDPYGQAWLVRVALADPAELDALMDATAYEAFVAEQEH